MTATISPAAIGKQLVRVSLPLPRGLLQPGEALTAADGRRRTVAPVRVLTWRPAQEQVERSARRALVTFPYDFPSRDPVQFVLRPRSQAESDERSWAAPITVDATSVAIELPGERQMTARLIAPEISLEAPVERETIESNAYFLWERWKIPDPTWPRVIEVRRDALGTVVLVAHLQRNEQGHGYAPDFGWGVEVTSASPALFRAVGEAAIGAIPIQHSFANGQSCDVLLAGKQLKLYHPAAPLKLKGRVEVSTSKDGTLAYRHLVWAAEDRAPMQQAAWRRAELVISPSRLAPLRPTLEYPHQARLDPTLFDEQYGAVPAPDLADHPKLAELMQYHRNAIVRSMAHGVDWGNVTGYSDGGEAGGVFGMNRLNHCPPIFEEGYRSGDRRLVEVGVLWCDNMYDQSIWWGEPQRGGTRYNNLRAMGQAPPDDDNSYMWRSLSSVNFCTKGYDTFLLAYEETGDPRMMEALDAQVAYASQHVHSDQGEARNVGDVRDFVRLYRYTGEQRYLDEALRLFREVRPKLSEGDLFSQSGRPIDPDPPFIDDDQLGYQHPFAKPYIIGYALAGLPELAEYAPAEPKLREVIQAVADFLAESQDPIGGWRYPHPRSSHMILSQAIEHAWQLVQADRFLGPQEHHLDAIERVLRQRIQCWLKTSQCLSGLGGWEIATGKVKLRKELYDLYQRPEDRDFTRDYAEGSVGVGSSPPEGIVYFPEVLAFYLEHRPASRLLTKPDEDDPLGIVLGRLAEH